MMQMGPVDRARRISELAESLRMSVSPEARCVTELITLKLEDLKDNLVRATGDDMLRVQGAARVIGQIHQALTQAPKVPRATKE